MDSALDFYALRTVPQREKMVRDILRHHGLMASIKTEQRLRKRTARDKVRRPQTYCAASGYCFVGLPRQGNPWTYVHRYHLIQSVVSLNGVPVRLRPKALADFLGYDDYSVPEYFRFFRTGEPEFGPGDVVRIDEGHSVLGGRELPVIDIREGEAIFALVMFGQQIEARVRLDDCYKAA